MLLCCCCNAVTWCVLNLLSLFLSLLLGGGVEFLFRFGSGVLSIACFVCLLLRQLPRTGSNAAEPWTRRETVLTRNCFTVGLSLRPLLARCLPKKASTGSWQNRSLNKYFTPGCCSRYFAISTNACTISEIKLQLVKGIGLSQ